MNTRTTLGDTPVQNAAIATNRVPAWYARGACIYRLATPDSANVLPHVAEGLAMVANLFDGTIPQITMVSGLIGHDHPGAWNWDGLWPYWNRTTFRAGSFEQFAAFMAETKKNSNVYTGLHLNLTDVNIGLRDYADSRDFFKRLVDTRSIYRRDRDKITNKRVGEPYVPTEIDKYADDEDNLDPVQIFALVNYKNFWDSGLAKEMIDSFYDRLPYAPPLLYLDVLNACGGNFATGAPDGPLGGSEETQVEGMQSIVDYLRSKGTDTGTEGKRPFLGMNAQGLPRAGYVWFHGDGFSSDDYSVISGGHSKPVVEQTYGSAGGFNVSPIACTPEHLEAVREHYVALLSGETSSKKMPGIETDHIAQRFGNDEFDIPGAPHAYRGDWADLVNNFYLMSIQELYHVGKGNTRIARSPDLGWHFDRAILTSPSGQQIILNALDFVSNWTRPDAIKAGEICMQFASTLTLSVDITEPGNYGLKLRLNTPDHDGEVNLYVNGEFHQNTCIEQLGPQPVTENWPAVDFGTVQLHAGANTIVVDTGKITAEWSDGTKAVWTTPGIHKGFKVWRDEVIFADDYDRMWPDTWSGNKKIYFFSWDGTHRTWKLPTDWANERTALLYPLTLSGRGKPVTLLIDNREAAPVLLPQIPYVLVPAGAEAQGE